MSNVILWARDAAPSPDTVRPDELLGPPDGRSGGPGASTGSVTLSRFEGGFYSGLLSLLDGHVGGTALPGFPPRRGARRPIGDKVTAGDLARADVIAFELNGGGSAGSGGWESCEWLFEDGRAAPVRVRWDERASARASADPHVVANGSTDSDRYSRFFGIVPPTTDGPSPSFVISYILFSLPTLSIASPSFAITLRPYLVGAPGTPKNPERSEGTPDVDAVGVLACSRPKKKTPKPAKP